MKYIKTYESFGYENYELTNEEFKDFFNKVKTFFGFSDLTYEQERELQKAANTCKDTVEFKQCQTKAEEALKNEPGSIEKLTGETEVSSVIIDKGDIEELKQVSESFRIKLLESSTDTREIENKVIKRIVKTIADKLALGIWGISLVGAIISMLCSFGIIGPLIVAGIPLTKAVAFFVGLLISSHSLRVLLNREYHVVKDGEDLEGISKKYNLTVDELKSWNGIKDDKLVPGTKLKVSKPL